MCREQLNNWYETYQTEFVPIIGCIGKLGTCYKMKKLTNSDQSHEPIKEHNLRERHTRGGIGLDFLREKSRKKVETCTKVWDFIQSLNTEINENSNFSFKLSIIPRQVFRRCNHPFVDMSHPP